jgi:hypothetical protein
MTSQNLKETDMSKSVIVKTAGVVLSGVFPALLWAGPVDVNTADAENEYGAFQSADELMNVAGIGQHILDVNRTNILVEKSQ